MSIYGPFRRLETPVSQTTRMIALCLCTNVGLGALACATRSSDDRPQAAPIVGNWILETTPPESLPGRMLLEVRIDSVSAGRLYGRLVHYFAGDVGVDSSAFPQFDGEIGGARVVQLVIRAAANPSAAFRLTGPLGRDTIPLETFIVGPDTLSGHERDWRLVRRKN